MLRLIHHDAARLRRTGTAGAGLDDDVAAVRQVLQDGDEPTVVVGHSDGGIVTA